MTEAQPRPQNKRGYVAIFIYPETRKQLALAKIKHGFKSYDDLIMHLLKVAGYADQ